MSSIYQFDVSLKQDKLYCYFNGIATEKAIERFIRMFQDQVKRLAPQPFGMIFDWRNFQGATPLAQQRYNQFCLWLNGQGLKAKAFVVNNDLQVKIALHQQPGLQELEPIIRVFACPTEAENWIDTRIANYPLPSANDEYSFPQQEEG